MKPILQILQDFTPIKLHVEAEPLYWKDATINGIPDNKEGDHVPLKVGALWKLTIDLETGRIENWPAGTTAAIHYKVCDQGRYYLEDAQGRRARYASDYVPNSLLCPGMNGYGDYIILGISGDGTIAHWDKAQIDPSAWLSEPAQA